MSLYINRNPAPNGDPNGIIYAPAGALFLKTGSFYKINNSGSNGGTWETVFFQQTKDPFLFRTLRDIGLLKRVQTGSFLYVKTTTKLYDTGWKLVSNKTPLFIQPTPTPSVTRTVTPTPTVTRTLTPTPTVTQTSTQTPTVSQTPTTTPTPTITDTPTQTPTPTITDTPTSTPTGTIQPTPTPTSTPPSGAQLWNTNSDLWNNENQQWNLV